jgi:hypothetical protein
VCSTRSSDVVLYVSDHEEDVILAPTQLGSAVVASALSPDEGLAVFAELQKARRCFVLENELHTVYLVCCKFCFELVEWNKNNSCANRFPVEPLADYQDWNAIGFMPVHCVMPLL